MCGIFGAVSQGGMPLLVGSALDCLDLLEYRGYDSSGLAYLAQDNKIEIVKCSGRVKQLRALLGKRSYLSTPAIISHTRWATHGPPTESNAHPHACDGLAVVHNGIIKNHLSLRKLVAENLDYEYLSDTDTEVILSLVCLLKKQGVLLHDIPLKILEMLEGNFAILLMSSSNGAVYALKNGSPIVVGKDLMTGQATASSDVNALRKTGAAQAYILPDLCYAALEPDSTKFFDAKGNPLQLEPFDVSSSTSVADTFDKHGHPTFMMKEICEQPQRTRDIISKYFQDERFQLPKFKTDLSEIKSVHFISCGSSYYSSLMAQAWLFRFANIPVRCSISSEITIDNVGLNAEKCLYVLISQSGETLDTINALRTLLQRKPASSRALVVTNTPVSSMAVLTEELAEIFCGPEIGVAATKSFTGQLVVLAVLVRLLSDAIGKNATDHQAFKDRLLCIPDGLSSVIQHSNNNKKIKNIASEIAHKMQSRHCNVIYTGKGELHVLALEAALKTQELSYRTAIAVSAGEIKHGPMSLLDSNAYVILFMHSKHLCEKSNNAISEVLARNANVVLISDVCHSGVADERFIDMSDVTLEGGQSGFDCFVTPIGYAAAVHLISYYIAEALGNDIDKPRGLAKSVTVE